MAKRKPKQAEGAATPPPPSAPSAAEVFIGGVGDAFPEPPKHLEDVLIAIQKSFSRVSAASTTSIVGDSNARALITGTVDFDLTARFDLTYKPGAASRSSGRSPGSSGVGSGVGSGRGAGVYAGMGFSVVEIAGTPPTPDQLRLDPNGAIQLHLKGTLSTDVRIVASGTPAEPTGEQPANPSGASSTSPGTGFEVEPTDARTQP